jgi:DNA polymerase III delta prime subunit
MLSISWRSILRVIAGASLIVAIICIFNPKYESWIPVVAAIVTFASSFAVSDTPISSLTSEKTKSTREERHRQDLLKRVKNGWVKGVLEQSLHGEVLIELGLEERRDAVLTRQGIELQTPGKPNRLLPPGTEIVDVFDELGQTLLILGEPGSGKTTMLLELARDTIARAEEDPIHRIPVVFNLSSWTGAKQTITDWLVGELDTEYSIRKKIASDWIENDDLLLLLDGLDEVLPERREACARAINDFRREHGLLTPLVVCCRSEEYKTLSNRLYLGGAVSLQPLTPEQVDDYLGRMGQELAALRTTLKDDSELCELAQTPLMLSIMTLAYRGMSVHGLQPLETINARRKHIFDNYVERMFKPRAHRTILDVSDAKRPGDERFPKEKTIHWLSWLAKRMSQQGQTIFLIEKMQPDWLPTRAQQRIVTVGIAVMVGIFFGLLSWFSSGFYFEMLAGLMIAYGGYGYSKDIRPVETLRFSWGVMLTAAVIAGLLVWRLYFDHPYVPLIGLFSALFIGLLFGLIKGEIDTRTVPNEGIRRSARNALYIWLLIVLLFGLLGGLFFKTPSGLFVGIIGGVLIGLFSGLPLCLHYGGLACIQHFVLRIMLWRNGSAPLNYVRFLDYAAGCIFLRKVGGGYIFVHRLLLEYFASLEPEEEGG